MVRQFYVVAILAVLGVSTPAWSATAPSAPATGDAFEPAIAAPPDKAPDLPELQRARAACEGGGIRADLQVVECGRVIQFALPMDDGEAARLFTNRSKAYATIKDYARAIADADQAARRLSNADTENARCWWRAVAGVELEIARDACNTARRSGGNDANILDSRGLVGLKQGRFEDAWADYNFAFSTEPQAGYLFGRGIAAFKLGLVEEAKADVARAKQMNGIIDLIYADYGIDASEITGVSLVGRFITNADWIRTPSADDMSKFYPGRARRMLQSGAVMLICHVVEQGYVDRCRVAAENPSDFGFGEAALKLSSLFQMRPMAVDGAPVAGAQVGIPIRFQISR